jgi:succinate-acetate transporter protein
VTLEAQHLQKQIKAWLAIFIAGLLISGLTAFPLSWELGILKSIVSHPALPLSALLPDLVSWITFVNTGLQDTYSAYAFMAYGTDWLAFAHIVIAVAFIGPWRDPVRNIWVIEFGMIACGLILPLALIAGPLRGIPFF